jgi:outer membrane protein assembly factor BamB
VPNRKSKRAPEPATIVREYGPFAGTDHVRGVTFDGSRVWFAAGERLQSFDPESGTQGRSLPTAADAGTAFDGRYLFQIAGGRIHKIDPETGTIVATLPAPESAHYAGLTWAEGTLWVALHHERKILQLDPDTGRVLRTVESPRFVTGVTWVDGELWHATWEGDESDVRRVDPDSGEVLESLTMPTGTYVTGLESNGDDLFFCGGGRSGKVRAVRKPKRD